jgi:hypothetical protein
MAANVNVTVTGTLVDGAGAVVTSAIVKAQRSDVSLLQSATQNTADTAEATSNSSTGIFSLTLKGYDLMAVTHKVTLPDGRYFYLTLPANAKSVGLGKITCGRTPGRGPKDITALVTAGLKFIGQDLASAAALPEPTCDVHVVTGTTTITSILATNFPVGKVLILITSGSVTINDGNNLSLTGNLSMTANDTLALVFDGTNFSQLAAPPAI